MQNQDVAACVKHHADNNQEVNCRAIDVQISEIALGEIVFPDFKEAIEEREFMCGTSVTKVIATRATR